MFVAEASTQSADMQGRWHLHAEALALACRVAEGCKVVSVECACGPQEYWV